MYVVRVCVASANPLQLVLAGAVNITPGGFHAADLGTPPKKDTLSNDVF